MDFFSKPFLFNGVGGLFLQQNDDLCKYGGTEGNRLSFYTFYPTHSFLQEVLRWLKELICLWWVFERVVGYKNNRYPFTRWLGVLCTTQVDVFARGFLNGSIFVSLASLPPAELMNSLVLIHVPLTSQPTCDATDTHKRIAGLVQLASLHNEWSSRARPNQAAATSRIT